MSIKLKNHNIIFIHPPKCGGSSVTQELQRIDAVENVGKGAHRTIENLKELGFEADEYFVTVRNPYDRFYSYYHFCIEWDQKRITGELPLKDYDKEGLKSRRQTMLDMGFKGWVNLLLDEDKRENFIAKHSLIKAFQTQTVHFLNQTTKPVNIFKIEEGGVWKYLNDLGYKVEPRHIKKSTYKTVEYTQEQKDIVYEYFKEDFEELKYER